VIARGITLIESRRSDHQRLARQLVQDLLPFTGNAVRVGITGAPGVGKSTTIDALGSFLTGQGHSVAVLAVDPSSTRSGGSILADKTRMARLGSDANAFVRPLSLLRHAGRRCGQDAGVDVDLRGRGL
jgi:Putative periplasmic protein kinase ArgK and related GTPases of G3E family